MRPLLTVLGVLFAIGCIPVSLCFRYFDGFELKLILAGIFRWRLLPQKGLTPAQQEKQARKKAKKAGEKEKKKQKKKAEALLAPPKEAPKPEAPQKPLGDKIEALLPWARLAARFAGEFFSRKLSVTRLRIRVVLAGEDPAKTGRLTARAWQSIGLALPILERAFRIRERKIAVYPDFRAEKTELEAELRIRLRIGGVVLLTLKYACKALWLWIRGKRADKKRKKEQTRLVQNNGKAG